MFSLKTLTAAIVLVSSSLVAGCSAEVVSDEPQAESSQEIVLRQEHVVTVVAIAKVKPGTEHKFEAAALDLVTGTRREPGNVSYTLLESKSDPTELVFYERWTSTAAIDAHMNGAVLATFFAKVKDDFEPGYPQIKQLDTVEPHGKGTTPSKGQ